MKNTDQITLVVNIPEKVVLRMKRCLSGCTNTFRILWHLATRLDLVTPLRLGS